MLYEKDTRCSGSPVLQLAGLTNVAFAFELHVLCNLP